MLDLGWSEMAVIALLALIVIGPKDLPRVLRTMGQFMRKARSLSREFQSGLNEVMREAELEDARKAIEKTRPGQLDREIRKALDPDDEVDKELRDVDRVARETANTRTPVGTKAKQESSGGAATGDKSIGGGGSGAGKVVRHPAGNAAETAEAAGDEKASDADERRTQQTG